MAERLVIIGSGPAGWTCAIYAARANLSPLVYEGAISEENRLRGTLPLGQLNLTTEVENFPGFPEGIDGPALMLRMREQAERYGARIITDDIIDIDLSKRPFAMTDSAGTQLVAHAVVIATGASANYLGLASEELFKNRGVSACAVCEEGTYLTKFASTVYVVHRRDSMNRASPIMADRLLSNPKVSPVWHSVVEEVLGDDEHGMTAARVKNVNTGEEKVLDAVGMFLAIGHTPNTKFLRNQVDLDEKGFIRLADPLRTTTSVEGVFAAGDVADSTYRQAITAAGMGCKAALDAERWLAAKGIH
jgi:thioredoxin reductase (NADPH)